MNFSARLKSGLIVKAYNSGGFVVISAADRGGAGYMIPGECDMMENNALINIYMISEAVKLPRLPKYFFSSSVCVYKDMPVGAPAINEDSVYPANPENEYGWEKLYTERMLSAFSRRLYAGKNCQVSYHLWFEANWEGRRKPGCTQKSSFSRKQPVRRSLGDGKFRYLHRDPPRYRKHAVGSKRSYKYQQSNMSLLMNWQNYHQGFRKNRKSSMLPGMLESCQKFQQSKSIPQAGRQNIP
jgi:hypothetical protein